MAARAETIVHMSNLQKRIQDRKKVQQDLVHKKRDYEKQVSLEPGVDRSLFLLTHRNVIRRVCLRVVKSKPFEGLIIFAIIANSILLGLSDFSVVDKYLNPASDGVSFENGAIIKAFSMRNYILEVTETPFTILFTCEAIMKIIALGFVGSRGSYLRDSWNQLDFFVVLSSLVSVLPSVPNVSVIRTIRVLRPLRSLSMIPGLRRLISALLKALPALANVLVLQFFVFLIFGILGIQLFGGNLNRRCRLTNFPVKLPMNSSVPQWPVPDDYLSQVLANPQAYRCLDAPMLDDGDLANGNFTKETSPWKRPQDCFWPFDADDSQVCVVPGVSGQHPCGTGRTCGSDFDTLGNPRFTLTKVTNSALYDVNFNWGYTSFDNIGRAFFTIFQSITQQGWTLLMYMTMDSGPPLAGAIFFVTLIVFASFFVMNLTLAVITDEFNIEDDTVPDKTEVEVRVDKIRAMAKAKLHIQRDKPRYPRLFSIVSHPAFSAFIMVVILANTTVLALDHYPMPSRLDSNLEIANFVLSCVFLLEMILMLLGLGFRLYTKDTFNLFDAFVVTMSVVETIVTPPSFFGTQEAVRKRAVSTLRSFRLFRIFKLARDWQSLRELLAMIVRAFASIGNFGVLLFLFIYIYALVGMQFFANTMRFDSDGYLIIGNGVDFWHGDLPRNNFDSMLWSVVTVFQIISGDNWNNVMYDTMRGNGWGASLYFITLIVLGNFILMNLFLALLLDNFDTSGNNSTAAETRTDRIKNLAIRMSTIKVLPIQQSARVLGVQEELPSTTPAMRTKSSAEKGVMDKTSLNAAGLDNFSREEQHELAHIQCGSPSIRDLSLKKESITA